MWVQCWTGDARSECRERWVETVIWTVEGRDWATAGGTEGSGLTRKHTWRQLQRSIWRNNGWKLPTLLKAMQLQIHKTQWTSTRINTWEFMHMARCKTGTVNVLSRSVRVRDEMGKGWSQKIAKEPGPRELLPRLTGWTWLLARVKPPEVYSTQCIHLLIK